MGEAKDACKDMDCSKQVKHCLMKAVLEEVLMAAEAVILDEADDACLHDKAYSVCSVLKSPWFGDYDYNSSGDNDDYNSSSHSMPESMPVSVFESMPDSM